MRQFSKREQVIFITCLILVIVFIGNNGIIKPFQNRIATLDQSIESKEREYRKNLRVIQKAKSLDQQYRNNLAPYKQTKSNEQVMASILSEIESVAKNLKLQISDLKPKKVREQNEVNRFSVSLAINSNFIEIIHFLYILQNEPHQYNVEEVSFNKNSRKRSSSLKTSLVLSKTLIP